MISIISACIFYCVNPAGMVAFQDRPCASSHTQRVLDDVHTYPLILASNQSDQSYSSGNPVEALAQAKKNVLIYKKEQAYQKKQKRLAAQQARQSKQALLAQRRIERRQLHCQKTGESHSRFLTEAAKQRIYLHSRPATSRRHSTNLDPKKRICFPPRITRPMQIRQ